ncbi:hypothetical protein M5K25_001922 [Dendrobium thyrsiflorum]|uniref:DUF4283 domain-containing protein n=1 Tax=Dendrobium thyrsiflorum TaxID=117978 RepID=A0ABD0VRP6_DENTH
MFPFGSQPVQEPPNAWNRSEVYKIDNVYKAVVMSEDDSSVTLNMESVHDNMDRHERGLVGKLFGRRLPFFVLSNELKHKWSVFGEFQLVSVSPDAFIYLFETAEASDAVVLGCPWVVVCMRMDLGAKFPLGVWITGLHVKFFQRAEYEGIANLCFHYGFVGNNNSSNPSSCVVNCDPNSSSSIQVALHPPHLETTNLQSGNDGQNPESYWLWSLVTSRKSRRLKKKNSNIDIGGKKTITPVSRGEVTEPAKHVAATMDGDLSNIPFKFSTEAFLVHPRCSGPRKDRASFPRATKELQRLGHFSDQPRKQKMDGGGDESR